MALDSYSGLKTAMASWLARADLTSELDDFIDLFEAWANRNLRMPQMESEATSAATEYMALPTNFLQLRDIQWQGSPRAQLPYVTPQQADFLFPDGSTATPIYHTIVGDQIRLVPPPSAATDIRIAYYAKLTALDSTNTTNWLLASHPDAYLFGSVFHGRVRITDPEMATFVVQMWQTIMAELKKSGREANLGSTLQTRPG